MESIVLETVATEEYKVKIAGQSDVIEAFYITRVILANMLKNNSIHSDLFIDLYSHLKVHADSK
jgi:hypothetical protein